MAALAAAEFVGVSVLKDGQKRFTYGKATSTGLPFPATNLHHLPRRRRHIALHVASSLALHPSSGQALIVHVAPPLSPQSLPF
jgi:hypothetical protein